MPIVTGPTPIIDPTPIVTDPTPDPMPITPPPTSPTTGNGAHSSSFEDYKNAERQAAKDRFRGDSTSSSGSMMK